MCTWADLFALHIASVAAKLATRALRERYSSFSPAIAAENEKGVLIMKRRLNRILDHGADRFVGRGDFAVALAVLQATPKAKAKLRPPDAAARFAIEKAL
jgi:hypothetical protein